MNILGSQRTLDIFIIHTSLIFYLKILKNNKEVSIHIS
jgi:hypothetical protein